MNKETQSKMSAIWQEHLARPSKDQVLSVT